jgi:hypothetical protein
MILNNILTFITAMSEVLDLPHIYKHFGINLGLWLLVIIAVLIDLWDGVMTARQLGKKIHSHKLRITINKMGEYWRIMLLGFVFDFIGVIFPWYGYPYLSILICVGIVLIEIKSVYEHIKRRKSKATELPAMIQKVIEVASSDEAEKVIKEIVKHFDDKKDD